VVGQYPYFAPDASGLKPAKEATTADKKLLLMYTGTKGNARIAKIQDSELYSARGDRGTDPEDILRK